MTWLCAGCNTERDDQEWPCDNCGDKHDPDFLKDLAPPTVQDSLVLVLSSAWESPFATKSNFARHEATFVGMACELGYITLKDEDGNFGTLWRVTPNGLYALFTKKKDLLNAKK